MSNKWIGSNEIPLIDKIKEYYVKRGLAKPSLWEALGWLTSELGEVYEVLFSWNPKWVRNSPENHPMKTEEELAEELGDVIFMAIVAGMVTGVDPINALEKKMERKLKENGLELWNPIVTTPYPLQGDGTVNVDENGNPISYEITANIDGSNKRIQWTDPETGITHSKPYHGK